MQHIICLKQFKWFSNAPGIEAFQKYIYVFIAKYELKWVSIWCWLDGALNDWKNQSNRSPIGYRTGIGKSFWHCTKGDKNFTLYEGRARCEPIRDMHWSILGIKYVFLHDTNIKRTQNASWVCNESLSQRPLFRLMDFMDFWKFLTNFRIPKCILKGRIKAAFKNKFRSLFGNTW